MLLENVEKVGRAEIAKTNVTPLEKGQITNAIFDAKEQTDQAMGKISEILENVPQLLSVLQATGS